ncbi:MAG TPA: low molecular weight protein-tyrosine-phosphatase [Alphaproteobacteria bacterium]|nr:low molecular weight protein-tyrosine-phosphatase [Alphaproteobacteria bacterium]
MVKILFVCTGNICRSPTAEGVFRKLVAEAGLDDAVAVDSAGTHGYHVGEPPDERSCAAALRRAVDITAQRARRVSRADFAEFDLILAMDRDHFRALRAMAPQGAAERVRLFLDYAPELGVKDVPDPYYGGPDGFEDVLDLIETAAEKLLLDLRRTHLSG